MKRVPILKDVAFILKWIKWPTKMEVSNKAWIVGVLMLAIGITGFIIKTIMSII